MGQYRFAQNLKQFGKDRIKQVSKVQPGERFLKNNVNSFLLTQLTILSGRYQMGLCVGGTRRTNSTKSILLQ